MAAWPDPADYGIPNTWIPGPGRLVQYESMSSLSDIERTILFNEAVLHQQYKEIIEKLEKQVLIYFRIFVRPANRTYFLGGGVIG